MSIPNPNAQPKDVVILQRSDNNAFYGEAHISGSKLIPHIDATGHINADDSASFYTLYPPPGGLVPGGLYPITASSATSASHAQSSDFSSFAVSSTSASWADRTLSGSYSISSSWADNALSSAYAVSASYEIIYEDSSSYAQTASWALNTLAAVSASWASQSLSTSFFITTDNPLPVDQRTVVADITSRDSIPVGDRYIGLTTWVVSESQYYTLIGGTSNAYWTKTPISASYASQSYLATTASFALNGGGGTGTVNLLGVNSLIPYWWNNNLSTSSLISATPSTVGINTITPDANDLLTLTELPTSSIPWDPTLLSTPPRFWFRADAIRLVSSSYVEQWPDSSPYRNDATASGATTRPVLTYNQLNGYPVVTFDGVNDRMKVLTPSVVSCSVITAFVVAKVTNYASSITASQIGTFIGNSSGSTGKNLVLGQRYDGGLSKWSWEIYTRDTVNAYTVQVPNAPYDAKTGEWYINTINITGAGSTTDLFLSASVSSSTATLSSNYDLRDLYIGYETSSMLPLDGQIAEIIIATASYTTAEQDRIEGYLAWKYGLVASLPATHPYKNVLPTASYRGDITVWRDYTGSVLSYVSASGQYVGTASWAVSASWAPAAPSDYSVSSSWASASLSSSYAQSASWAPLVPSDYAISASWASSSLSASLAESASWAASAFSSSYAQSASWADSGSWVSQSRFSSTSSWSSMSLSASYAQTASWSRNAITSSWSSQSFFALTSSYSTNQSENAISASWASMSLSSSFAITASYATNQNPNAVSSSWADFAKSSSWGQFAPSASFAHFARSSSYAQSASWAPPIPSDYAISASWASASFSASYAQSASQAISASYAPPIPIDIATSASWASSSLSSSYAQTASWTPGSISASYAKSASWADNAISASWAPSVGISGTDNFVPKWSSNSLTPTSLIYDSGNGVGIRATSSLQIDATLTVLAGQLTSSVLWTPQNLVTAKRVWLIGDNISGSNSSSVGRWPDTGSYNNYFTQSNAAIQPTLWTESLNSHSIVRFDGVSDRMSSVSGSTSIQQSSTNIFVVAKPNTFPTAPAIYSNGTVIGNGHAGNSRDVALGPRTYLGTTQWDLYNETAATAYNIDANVTISQSWYIVNACVNGVNSFLTVYINGAATSSGVVNGSNTIDLRDLYVGYEPTYAVPFNGDIAEILVTSASISDDDQRRVEGYLAWKYGLTGSLPSNHAYANSPPYALDAGTIIQSWKDQSAVTVAYVSSSGLYVGTASWANNAISASWSPPSGVTAVAISASWASSSLSASRADSASISVTASYLPVNLYQITSSWAQRASSSFFSNFASQAGTAGTASFAYSSSWSDYGGSSSYASQSYFASIALSSSAADSSSVALSASWARNALTASYLPPNVYNVTASYADSASWASMSFSGSYAQSSSFAITASWAEGGAVDSASWASSSIWAQSAVVADFALDSQYAWTASVALQGVTSSYAVTSTAADFALVAGWAFTSSYADIAMSASYAPSTPSVSASWASMSLSASYVLRAETTDFAVLAGNAYTASWAATSSWATTASSLSSVSSSYLTIYTSSMNWVTVSFEKTEQYLAITTPLSYSFTCSNLPQSGTVANVTLFIYNTAVDTSSLSFPGDWIFMGNSPNYISASRSAMLNLKNFGGTQTIATYTVQY